ncbi:hypothetical protein [Sphaerisporangium perillae]|uniref:hypothetical protein n=1 Tax=Sphaerisporangium perillae TaxID=2935860 RepID=UPI00200DF961|nr:hypothetical protein [Sphaerisporangium perillae]
MMTDVSQIMSRFEAAATDAVERIGPVGLRRLAELIGRDMPRSWILRSVPTTDYQEAAESITDALRELDDFSAEAAAAYLRGVAAGYECHPDSVTAESVRSGPSTHAVPQEADSGAASGLVF